MREESIEIEFDGPDPIGVQLRKHGLTASPESIARWERTDQAINGMLRAGIIREGHVWSAREALVAEMQMEVEYQ